MNKQVRHNIELFATFLPSKNNFLADRESRRGQLAGDWKLAESAFNSISAYWAIETDLFTSDWNARCPRYVSWFPQPRAWKVEALSISWKDLHGYAFPPFNLIKNCLTKLVQDQSTVVLVSPYWPSQSWFPTILELTMDIPRVLEPSQSLLTSSMGLNHPLTATGSIRLVPWKLSGVASQNRTFRTTLSNFYWPEIAPVHTLHTRPHGTTVVLEARSTFIGP